VNVTTAISRSIKFYNFESDKIKDIERMPHSTGNHFSNRFNNMAVLSGMIQNESAEMFILQFAIKFRTGIERN